MSVHCPTLNEAEAQGLYAADGKGIHTFSNGTSWHCWADANCYECKRYSKYVAGEFCAFEGAALLRGVSPALAEMFGWIQRETKYGPLSGWDAPARCRFLLPRNGDDDDSPPPPPPDPNQLVLIADPTEDAAIFATKTSQRELVGAVPERGRE